MAIYNPKALDSSAVGSGFSPLVAQFGVRMSEGRGTTSESWIEIVSAAQTSDTPTHLLELFRRTVLLSVLDGRAMLYLRGAPISPDDRSEFQNLAETLNSSSGNVIPCYTFDVVHRSELLTGMKPILNVSSSQTSAALDFLDYAMSLRHQLLYVQLPDIGMFGGLQTWFDLWTKVLPDYFGKLVHVSLRERLGFDEAAFEASVENYANMMNSANITLVTCADNAHALSTNAEWAFVTAIAAAVSSGQTVVVAGVAPINELAEKYQLWRDVLTHTPCQELKLAKKEPEISMSLRNIHILDRSGASLHDCSDDAILEPILALPSPDHMLQLEQRAHPSQGECSIAKPKGDKPTTGLVVEFVEAAAVVLNVREADLRALNERRTPDHKARALLAYGFSCLRLSEDDEFVRHMRYADMDCYFEDIRKGAALVEKQKRSARKYTPLMRALIDVRARLLDGEQDVDAIDPGIGFDQFDNVIPFPTNSYDHTGVFSRVLLEL